MLPPTLVALLQTNPHRTETVSPIVCKVISDTQAGEDAPSTLCGWIPTPLEPPGPLSVVLWNTNPEFRAGTPPVRRTILRETIVSLTKRVETELKGHRWSRKKIIEQLAAQQSADCSPPQDTRELDAALAYLFEVQLVVVDEANRKVSWVPEDPRTWSASRPVWGITLGSRAILHRPNETSVGEDLSAWVSEREQDRWTFHWPVADGTLEDLRAKLGAMNVGLGPRIEKPKKADYAAAVGRAESIRHLETYFSKNWNPSGRASLV